MSSEKGGAPAGNDHAHKGRLWREAIKRALGNHVKGTVAQGLDEVARKLVIAAMAGDKWAVEHIADRVDGKPPQSVTLAGEEGAPPIQHRIVRYVGGLRDSNAAEAGTAAVSSALQDPLRGSGSD